MVALVRRREVKGVECCSDYVLDYMIDIKMCKRILLLLLLFSSATLLRSQSILSRCEVGLGLGGMTYIGDLNDQSMLGKVRPAAGLTARLNIDPRWAVALGFSYGQVEGGNPDVIARRNLSFRSPIAEGFLRAEFNFFPYGLISNTQKLSTPYIFCGVGLFKFNPKAKYTEPATGESTWYELQPLATEGQGTMAYPDRQMYQLLEVCMPFGIGYKWRLSRSVHLSVEYGWRKTWTDYLDDVSTTYVGAEVLNPGDGRGMMAVVLADRSGEVEPGYVNPVGVKRGDDSLKDWYSFFHISLTFSAEVLFGWMRGKVCEL